MANFDPDIKKSHTDMRFHTAISMIMLASYAHISAASDTRPEPLCQTVQNQNELEAAINKNKGVAHIIYARADWSMAGREMDTYVPSEKFKSVIGETKCIIADATNSGGNDIQSKYSIIGVPFIVLLDNTHKVAARLTGSRTFTEFKTWFQSPGHVPDNQAIPSVHDTTPTAKPDDTIISLRKLATQGDREAQFMLGARGINGGIPIDESIHWLTQASHQGCIGATGMLGMLYLSEEHNRKDEAKAIPLIKIAADQGDFSSQTLLSGLLYKGHPILPRDSEASYAWAYLSHLSAPTPLISMTIKYQLAAIEPSLTKKQINDAQQWAKNKFSNQGASTSLCMQSMPI